MCLGEADILGSLDRFVRRRFRRSEADLTGGTGQDTEKNERTVINPHPLPHELKG
ncbi:hypothetical protein PbDSM24746_20540 [Paenibacillus macerans]|nr:hypothetical protein PbDSM24746_20540 [Paenibacillus macerans]GBK68358.1 hypothetical protein PbJCM17693_20660 [Paenibacillus macerans]GIP13471.1 hypothetical protein J1TS5_56410 [Paenibacillus macerans]